MSTPRKSLADGMRSLKREEGAIAGKSQQVDQRLVEASGKGKYYRPCREKTKAIVAYADPVVSKQLKQLALNLDTNSQALVFDALNLLFEREGLPQIAPKRE